MSFNHKPLLLVCVLFDHFIQVNSSNRNKKKNNMNGCLIVVCLTVSTVVRCGLGIALCTVVG